METISAVFFYGKKNTVFFVWRNCELREKLMEKMEQEEKKPLFLVKSA